MSAITSVSVRELPAHELRPGRPIYCHEFVELITDYMEGKLDEPTRVEAHICAMRWLRAQYLRHMR